MSKKREFVVGDEIEVVKAHECSNGNIKEGMKGKVVYIHPSGAPRIGVEFGEDVGGHNCDGKCKKRNNGWYMTESAIEILSEEAVATPSPITSSDDIKDKMEDLTVIYKGGVTTVILTDGSKGIAKLMDGDKYNREKGFLLAKARAEIHRKQREINALKTQIKLIGGQNE